MILFRLRLALFAAVQAWKQAPDAIDAVRNSCETGGGWNALDYGDGFVDLFSPCYDRIYGR